MIRLLIGNGFRRGVLGGSRFWLVLGGFGLMVKVLRKLAGNEPVTVYSEKLEPGQAVLIAHESPAPR